jgi:hypothetical protein
LTQRRGTATLSTCKMRLQVDRRRVAEKGNSYQEIPYFLWKYSYHTYHSENTERPNSPNVLPMSRVMWVCGILRFSELQCSSGDLERTVGFE